MFKAFSAARDGSNTCSVVAIPHSRELKGTDEAEAEVVVTVRGRVVVAIGDAAILRVVVPRAAAVHAVVTLLVFDRWRESTLSRNFLVRAWPKNANNGRARRWQEASSHSPVS